MIVEIDSEVNEKLEAISLKRNQSKGYVALLLCEFFLGEGVPHRHDTLLSREGENFLARGGAHPAI